MLAVTTAISCTMQTAYSNPPSPDAASRQGNQVLRHAVFFKFKDTSTPQDIKQVTDAISALPAKIPEITELEWGENINKNEFADGFTHCFLLTFKNEAGRATYLPHPDHKAFGAVLGPHFDKAFVIDYWGTPPPRADEKELKHFVFFKFKKTAPAAEVRAIEEAFAALPTKIDTIKAFEWGKNNSPEKHDAGFTHAFAVTFASEADLAKYMSHPEHEAFAAMLKPVVDGIRVLDFWAERVK